MIKILNLLKKTMIRFLKNKNYFLNSGLVVCRSVDDVLFVVSPGFCSDLEIVTFCWMSYNNSNQEINEQQSVHNTLNPTDKHNFDRL